MSTREQMADGSIRLAGGVESRLAPGWVFSALTAYNTVTDSGFYVMDSTASNSPWTATSYLEVRRYATTYIEQVARHVVTGLRATRYMTAGVWGSWVEDCTDLLLTGDSSWTHGSRLTRRGNSCTVYFNVTANVAQGGGNGVLQLPARHRPAGTIGQPLYFEAVDSGSGGTCPVYLNNNGYFAHIFARSAGAGTLGIITFTSTGN